LELILTVLGEWGGGVKVISRTALADTNSG